VSDGQVHVIVNLTSGGGRTAKRWPQMQRDIEDIFGTFKVSKTHAPFAGEGLTRQALDEGADLIIAIGGDGTFSEAVNGFIENDQLVNPSASLGFVTSGTGGDVRKTLGWPVIEDFRSMIELIASGQSRYLDVGKLTHQTNDNQTAVRYVINVSSFGVSGTIADAVNGSKVAKLLGGSFAFSWHALSHGLRYKNQKIRLQLDDDFDEEFSIILVAVANCQFFGGGLQVAPAADPQDGLLDVLIGHDISSLQLPSLLKAMYEGAHVPHPKIITRRARRIVATPLPEERPVRIEVDGESTGKLSSVYEILPRLIPIRG